MGSENGKKLAHKAQDEKLLKHWIYARHSTHKASKWQPSSAFDGLRGVINLVRGCKVMLTRNIAYKYGLANGTRGKLVGVVYPAGAPVASFPEALFYSFIPLVLHNSTNLPKHITAAWMDARFLIVRRNKG